MDMKLRMFRTFSWELACSPFEVRLGGDNPMKLVSRDRLQQYDGSVWLDIPIIEDERPEHPKTKKDREWYERLCNLGESKLPALLNAKKVDRKGGK